MLKEKLRSNTIIYVLLSSLLLSTSLLLLFRPWPFYPPLRITRNIVSDEIKIEVKAQNYSGEQGVASIREVNGRVVIIMHLENAPKDVRQSAFLYKGSCDNLGEVMYYLPVSYDGKYTLTFYGKNLRDLRKELPLAIFVTKSVDEPNIVYSCGNWAE